MLTMATGKCQEVQMVPSSTSLKPGSIKLKPFFPFSFFVEGGGDQSCFSLRISLQSNQMSLFGCQFYQTNTEPGTEKGLLGGGGLGRS